MFRWNKWALALPVAGLFALAICHAADPVAKQKSDGASAQDLVVHEWGTFSTFAGSDGKNLKFHPYDNDLPDFTHGYEGRYSKSGPQGGLISLETPVLYFYSEHPVTAYAQVEFPKGTMTEWYPYAVRTEKKLVWKDIKVMPGEKMKFPMEKKDSRYYAARETEAASVRVTFTEEGNKKTEQEKFLFYRGVGNFDMPLSVRALGEGKFSVRWRGDSLKDDLILVRVQDGKIRFQPFRVDRDVKCGLEGTVSVPDADSTVDKLCDFVVKQLTDKGLYEPEARAMVKTWRPAWFGEEGTRVLYILPDQLTEELLPLHVEPRPTSQLRVLVGRHDVLTPEKEKKIDTLVSEINRAESEQTTEQRAAWQELVKLGRYTEAARTASEARLKKNK